MKNLFLIRHAKSSWDDSSQNDFERPLNKRGFADASAMAKSLKDKVAMPDLIISSPANRALSTANIFAEELGFASDKIQTDERIYDAGLRQLFDVAREIEDSKNIVLLFGHNPGLTSFTNLLGDKYIPDMPTCSITGLEFEFSSWKELDRYSGKLILFDYPKAHRK